MGILGPGLWLLVNAGIIGPARPTLQPRGEGTVASFGGELVMEWGRKSQVGREPRPPTGRCCAWAAFSASLYQAIGFLRDNI